MDIETIEFTPFSEIYKMFLLSIHDYRIKSLFHDTPEVGDELLEQFLTESIAKFINCVKPIQTVYTINKTFNCNLDVVEKTILKDGMVLAWVDWSVNDIMQMNWSLNDTDLLVRAKSAIYENI